jgi:putative transposase
MPWQETSVMDQREPCRRFGISPDVAYKWIRRWTAGDEESADRSRRPHGSPGRGEAMMERRVLAVRDAHPAWAGARSRGVLRMTGSCRRRCRPF